MELLHAIGYFVFEFAGGFSEDFLINKHDKNILNTH